MNMKKIMAVLSLVILFGSCKKNKDCEAIIPTKVAPANEVTYLQNFLAANNITSASEKNGMFYVIDNPGSGDSPNLCSQCTMTYAGNLINGTTVGAQFDATLPGKTFTSALDRLIVGWQYIMPLVKKGGSATLYIPPTLGYGNVAAGASIPANSYLKFTVGLVDVQ
jgi:FKBP-type peptidyl-prolyl cis-trans isomerase FkpA